MTRSGAQFLMVVSTLALLTGLAFWKGVFTHRYVLPPVPKTGYPADERRGQPATSEDRMTDQQLAQEEAEVEAMDLPPGSSDRTGARTETPTNTSRLQSTGVASDPRQGNGQPRGPAASSQRRTGSIPFPAKTGQSREAEAADMRAMAKVTVDEAEALALDEYPGGTVTTVVLGHETGYLVYSILVADKDGSTHDVRIDAGNGSVLRLTKGFVGDDETRRPQ